MGRVGLKHSSFRVSLSFLVDASPPLGGWLWQPSKTVLVEGR